MSFPVHGSPRPPAPVHIPDPPQTGWPTHPPPPIRLTRDPRRALPYRAARGASCCGGRGAERGRARACRGQRPGGKTPRRVAELLRPHLASAHGVSGVEITGPGFLNITLNDTASVALVE